MALTAIFEPRALVAVEEMGLRFRYGRMENSMETIGFLQRPWANRLCTMIRIVSALPTYVGCIVGELGTLLPDFDCQIAHCWKTISPSAILSLPLCVRLRGMPISRKPNGNDIRVDLKVAEISCGKAKGKRFRLINVTLPKDFKSLYLKKNLSRRSVQRTIIRTGRRGAESK
jgi:hypothetical protein